MVSTSTPVLRKANSAAYNVVAGWLGVQIPPPPQQRNKSRAGYRKTDHKRPRKQLRTRQRGDTVLELSAPARQMELL